MFKALGHWFKQIFDSSHPDQPVMASLPQAESTNQMTEQFVSIDAASHIVPYNETLLERARMQWQFGDWHSLANLDCDTLQHHPDRAKLALMAAAGHQQLGDQAAARQFTRLAQDWGCSRKLVAQVLIAGTYNTLAKAAALAGQMPRALKHFQSSITTGSPNTDLALATRARLAHQWQMLGLPLPAPSNAGKLDQTTGLEPDGNWLQAFIGSTIDGKNPLSPLNQVEGLLDGKRILIACYFQNLSGGGLHEYVRDSMRAIKGAGGTAILVCPKSRFSSEMMSEGFRVIENDFDEPNLVDSILKYGPYDLVHAHPGKSKTLGLKLKAILSTPLVYTIHGKWTANIEKNIDQVDRLICVSGHIVDIFNQHKLIHQSQVSLICNGYDTKLFKPLMSFSNSSDQFLGIYSGRIDQDKESAIQLLKEIWRAQAEGKLPNFKWIIAGDGLLLGDLKNDAITYFSEPSSVNFTGWLSRDELAKQLNNSAFAIAAGRSALEALGSGLPVIASGREGYFFIKDWSSLLRAEWSNFGGFGSEVISERKELIFDHIKEIYSNFANGLDSNLSALFSTHLRRNRSVMSFSEQLILQYAGAILKVSEAKK
jgi:glycosyltransferase involved in cell wall biosynthesis